jgi:hypothetical protein
MFSFEGLALKPDKFASVIGTGILYMHFYHGLDAKGTQSEPLYALIIILIWDACLSYGAKQAKY